MIVLADDAYERLASHSRERGWRTACVVMDANTEEATGRDVVRELRAAGVAVDELVFRQRSGLLAGDAEVATVRSRLDADAHPIAVGSGVITDIVRYAAHLNGSDFTSVPTAASMDGYTSGVAALQRDGVKVTYPARAPESIFADPRVAARAPAELTRSGIGDLLAKASARTDWLAAHLLYGEPFCEKADAMIYESLEFVTANVRGVLGGDVISLLNGLIQSGVAMAMVGSSRPASGCEHHASHYWDLLAALGRRAHGPHGLQTGYATRFATRLQRFAFGPEAPVPQTPIPPADPLGDWPGEPTADIVEAVAQKQHMVAAVPPDWPHDEARWTAVRTRLQPALELTPAVERALTEAAIPDRPGFLEIDEATLRATFPHATRLRARYTTVDFLEGQQRLEEAIAAMLTSGRARVGGSAGRTRP